MWKVPLFDTAFDKQELKAVEKIIKSGWITMGEVTKELEAEFSEFIGTKHAIAVSSGTAALHLANLALDIKGADEVICPALTFVAGPNSVLYTGAKPVFADATSLDDFNISPDDIKKRISNRTKAIQVLHYAGYPCDMNKVTNIADKHGLYVIEDCSHAPGAEYKGKKCGSLGDIGCFSFFSNKNMTAGEGGIVTTNDDNIAKRIRLMRSHAMTSVTLDRHLGHSFSYDVVGLGFNCRIDELHSAIARVQLKKLKKNNISRKKIAGFYKERLSSLKGIKLPFIENTEILSHHIFPIILDKSVSRSKFMEYMRSKGIQTSIHYPAIHLFNFYRSKFGYKRGLLPLTEEISKREVTLPLYPSMEEKDISCVCKVITDYFKKRKGVS